MTLGNYLKSYHIDVWRCQSHCSVMAVGAIAVDSSSSSSASHLSILIIMTWVIDSEVNTYLIVKEISREQQMLGANLLEVINKFDEV